MLPPTLLDWLFVITLEPAGNLTNSGPRSPTRVVSPAPTIPPIALPNGLSFDNRTPIEVTTAKARTAGNPKISPTIISVIEEKIS